MPKAPMVLERLDRLSVPEDLREQVRELQRDHRDLQTEHDRRGREITTLTDQLTQASRQVADRDLDIRRLETEIGRCHDHLLVLQSDRDRLTCALEVACRRLASPTADQDYTRGGWRATNRIAQEEGRR
jgi:hypothetical protein